MSKGQQMKRTPGRQHAAMGICALMSALWSLPAAAQPPPPPPAVAAPGPLVAGDAEATADEPPEEEELLDAGEHRRVGDHTFLTPTHLPTAFANTSLASIQGIGMYRFDAPRLGVGVDAQGNPGIVEGEEIAHTLLLYRQAFLGQIGILNRVSLDLKLAGKAAVGGDLDTVFRLGALAEVNAGGGPKVRIVTFDDIGLQLSAGLGLFYSRGLQLAPAEIVRNVSNVTGAMDQILMQTESADLQPALIIAEGLGPIGLQFAFAPSFAVAGSAAIGDYVPAHELRAGLHATLDIGELSEDAPIGLSAEYAIGYWLSSLESRGGELDHHVVGGLHYTGRRDLELGGALYVDILRPPVGPKPIEFGGQLVLHYFF